jgi:hypothetical protein
MVVNVKVTVISYVMSFIQSCADCVSLLLQICLLLETAQGNVSSKGDILYMHSSLIILNWFQ